MSTTTTHQPPKTFGRFLGIVGGQDLVCRLHIVQTTRPHSFDTPSPIFWDPNFFLTNVFFCPRPKIFRVPIFFFALNFFFRPKNISVYPKLFSEPKISFLTQTFFRLTIFSDSIFWVFGLKFF